MTPGVVPGMLKEPAKESTMPTPRKPSIAERLSQLTPRSPEERKALIAPARVTTGQHTDSATLRDIDQRK